MTAVEIKAGTKELYAHFQFSADHTARFYGLYDERTNYFMMMMMKRPVLRSVVASILPAFNLRASLYCC